MKRQHLGEDRLDPGEGEILAGRERPHPLTRGASDAS